MLSRSQIVRYFRSVGIPAVARNNVKKMIDAEFPDSAEKNTRVFHWSWADCIEREEEVLVSELKKQEIYTPVVENKIAVWYAEEERLAELRFKEHIKKMMEEQRRKEEQKEQEEQQKAKEESERYFRNSIVLSSESYGNGETLNKCLFRFKNIEQTGRFMKDIREKKVIFSPLAGYEKMVTDIVAAVSPKSSKQLDDAMTKKAVTDYSNAHSYFNFIKEKGIVTDPLPKSWSAPFIRVDGKAMNEIGLNLSGEEADNLMTEFVDSFINQTLPACSETNKHLVGLTFGRSLVSDTSCKTKKYNPGWRVRFLADTTDARVAASIKHDFQKNILSELALRAGKVETAYSDSVVNYYVPATASSNRSEKKAW